MKRSYTYLKGLLTLALAALTGGLWAADPVATWTDFNTLTSGNYTITKDAACTLNADGSITLGGTGLTVSGCPNMGNISVVMDVSTLPTSGDYTFVNYPCADGANVGLMYKSGKLEQEWNNDGNYGNATWTPGTGRYTITFAYGKLDGATTYVGNVAMISNGSIKTGSTSITSFTIGSYKADNLLPATGMTVHSISIYDSKINPLTARLESEQAQIASTAWLASFDGDSSTTGWINSWGGEAFATYVDTPNGKGGKIESGKHPWQDYTITSPFTVALYADISEVSVGTTTNGAALLLFGQKTGNNPAGNLGLAKKADNQVILSRNGTALATITNESLAIAGSYHLFVFGMDAEGNTFLYVDGQKATSTATTTLPTFGLQIGAMYAGIGAYVQGYGMIVDEVRGYSTCLNDEELATLATMLPTYMPPVSEATLEANAKYSTLNLAEGETTNITITLKDGVILEMDAAPTCATLTIIGEGASASVTSTIDAPFAKAASVALNGAALTLPATCLTATTHLNATTITLEGGATADAIVEITSVISIANGKTLKTKGYVNLSGANTIAAGGTLEVVSGETTFNAAEQGIKGTLTIDAGATLKNVRESDALAYGTNGVVVNVYGTLDMGETRWTIFANNNTINAYAGATIKGAGQSGAGALDIWNKANDAVAINVLKNGENAADVTISATIRYRELSVTFNVEEGVTANLTGTNADINTILGGLKIKGNGTLKLSGKNAYANGVGVTVESDATLIVAHAEALSTPVTNNGTITYMVAATPTNTLSGEGVTGVDTATLNMLSANLEGYTGSFAVANNGTLILPAGKEEGVTVTAGSTLKLNLTNDQLKAPYSTSATIDGGTLVYTKNAGAEEVTEGVEGGAYTPATAAVYTVADDTWSITPFANAPVEIDFGGTTEQSVNLAEILGEVTTIKSLTVKGANGGALASTGVTIPWTDIQTTVTVDSYTNQFGAITIYPNASLKLVAGQGGNLTYDVTGKIPEAGQARPKLIVSGIEGNGWGMNNDGKVISNVDLEVVGEKRFYMRTALIGENVAVISNVTGDAYVGMEGTEVTLIGLSGNGNFYAGNHWSGDAGAVTINLPAGAEYTFNGDFDQKSSGSLTVSGAGKLTLAGDNTYSNGTTINNGATLVAASATALGTGNVTNSGTLELNADVEATIAQAISGTGAVNVKAGTWALTAANGIDANVTIAADATLDVSAEGARLFKGTHASSPVLTVNGTLKLRNWTWGETNSLGCLAHDANRTIVNGGTVVFTESDSSERIFKLGTNGATLEIAEGKTYTSMKSIVGDGDLTINGGTLVLTTGDALSANSNAKVTVNGTLKATGTETRFFRTVLGNGKIIVPEGQFLAIGEATGHTGDPSGLSHFAGTLEVAGTFDARSWSGREYTIGACNIDMQGGSIVKQDGDAAAAKIVIASGKTLSGEGTIAIPLTLADGATLAGAVTVTGDVTVEGALTITHATKAEDVVITCNNAADIVASLPTLPTNLKYDVDGNTIKLAVAKVTVTLPAVTGATWYNGETPVSGEISVEPGTELVLKADEGYYLAGGDVKVTITDTTTEVTVPEGSVAEIIAKIGETPYTTLQAAIEAAAEGATITLVKDVEITTYVTITKSITLDLAKNSITRTDATENSTALYVNVDAADKTVTIQGEGFVTADHAVYVNAGTVIIKGGNFHGYNGGHAVYVQGTGNAEILGGTFSIDEVADSYNYVLNKYDADRETTTIVVKGGKFLGFNPAYCAAEGKGTNFCADGYTAVAGEGEDEGYYVVTEAPADAQAKIAGLYYNTLADALADADEGDTITLLADVTVAGTDADRVVITKAITIDGNDYTITATNKTANCRAINVDCEGEVTLQNLVVVAAGERGINVINKACTLTLTAVDVTAYNYAVNVAKSAGAAQITITNSALTGKNVVNVAAPGSNITIDGTTLTCIDEAANECYATLFLNKDAKGATITATNMTFNISGDSKKASNQAENGTITIDGSTADVSIHVATLVRGEYWYGFETIDAAVAKAQSGETITLIRDVTASEIITIEEAITLDGNGKTLTSTAGRAINVDCAGAVTIKNLTIDAGERAINIINKAATVTINGVTATADNNAVMIATSAGAVKLSIDGCSFTGLAVVSVNGAGAQVTIANSTIANVDANDNENYGAITVGATADNATVKVSGTTITVMDDSKKAYNFAPSATITGVDDVGCIVAMIGEAGYDTIEEAAGDVKAGQTIVLVTDVTVDAPVVVPAGATLDLNGKASTGTILGTIAVNGGKYITAEGQTVIGTDARTFESTDAVFTMDAVTGNISLDAGTVTAKNQDGAGNNWTLPGQTLTIKSGVTLNVPAGVTMQVNGTTVTIETGATLNIAGSINLYTADATIAAAEGLTVTTTVAGCEVKYANGTYTVVKSIVIEDVIAATPAAEAIKAAMEDAGVTEIETYTIFTKGADADADAEAVAAVLEVFDVEPTVGKDGKLTVKYEFGISAMTNVGDTVTITAGVTGAEYRAGVAVVFYADGAKLGAALSRDGKTVSITADAKEINGKKITVEASNEVRFE